MQVGESTLKSLIEGQRQFQVPLYQRQYTWDTAQLSQLWEDILEQYDLLTPDENGKLPDSPPAHFLGSMVLAPSPMMQAHGVTPFLVIDGQQRLTTVLIAMCALRDHVASMAPTEFERFNVLYLVNQFAKGPSYYRLLPTQSDRDAFFACVTPDPSRRTGRIGQAYSFFRAQLTQNGPDNQALNSERLEAVLWQRLQFVAITADQRDNVHRIFESLNARGVRLTQADLLRNYVFMLLPTRAEDVYEHVWRPMQDALSPVQLETLVYVDLVLRGKPSVKRQDIYREQQNRLRHLEGNEAAVEAEVRELARRAKFFERIVNPAREPEPSVRAAIERLNRWEASTTYPLLMHLHDAWDRGDCSTDDVIVTLSYVESFLVRRTLAAIPTNNLNRVFSALIPQIPQGVSIAEGTRQALSGERKYWPTDVTLREAFLSKPFYFQGRQEQKMLIFERLEESFKHAEPLNWAATNLSIEHIMPQSLTDDWRLALQQGGEDPDVVHSELLHTIGNLTVTAYNGQLSNSPFERKKEILQNSHLELNKAIAPEGTWARAEILMRADELADRAIEIWPAPLPGVPEPSTGKDWSRLHAALAALPYGAWTTYGDLAELVGSHQVPVGQHLASTPGLLNAHRVLNADGRVASGFYWPDANDKRDVHQVLQAEGVRFGPNMHADPELHLGAEELAGLIGDVQEPVPPAEAADYTWRLKRSLRYLRHFYEAPEGRLNEDVARSLAKQEGYDPRGVAGFYQGTASLRAEGSYRILTDAGRQWFEENRHHLD
jgi:uncharacterized protein with ParB-like and HNH nuclease domain/alkylated DNA nucleotide flippase Atl1